MIEGWWGRRHGLGTRICLRLRPESREERSPESPAVTFRALDAPKIRRYLNQVNPLDKAGGYAIQEEGDLIIESISGSYTNVLGLPVERLTSELKEWGA